MDKKQKIAEFYNKIAKSKKLDTFSARIKDIDRTFSFVKKADPKFLELGCGSGRDAKEILKRTDNYTGIDFSGEMVKIAQKSCPNGKFELKDIATCTFPKKQEIVFASASLHHFDKEKLEKIISKVHKSLAEKGVFFLSLKYGRYKKAERIDAFGERTYFKYTPTFIERMSVPTFSVLHKQTSIVREQKWFEMILQKK